MTEIDDWDRWLRSMTEIDDWDQWLSNDWDQWWRSILWRWLRSMPEINDWDDDWDRWLQLMTACVMWPMAMTDAFDRLLWPVCIHMHGVFQHCPSMLEPLMWKLSFDAFNRVYKHEVNALWRTVNSMALLYCGVGTAWSSLVVALLAHVAIMVNGCFCYCYIVPIVATR